MKPTGRTLILLITSRHILVSIYLVIYLIIYNLQVRSQGQVKISQWTQHQALYFQHTYAVLRMNGTVVLYDWFRRYCRYAYPPLRTAAC